MNKINQTYLNDISDYCRLNNIGDVDLFINQCLKQGFDVKKYGLLGVNNDEVIKEVIVEKEVEKIVEVIKEVEKIVEIPIEVKVIEYVDREIIKEIPVEKIVTKIEYISDKTNENELLLKIQQLELEMFKKDENLDDVRRSLDEHLDKPPVEIIKEVEIIREVEVDKNGDKIKMLSETLMKLRGQLTEKDGEINKLKKINNELEDSLRIKNAVYMKGSRLNENL